MKTNFSQIQFNPASHTYTLAGQRLTSATSYIKRFQQPFDRDYWSQRKADERGITADEILAEWDQKAIASREKGTRFHNHVEAVLTGQIDLDDPFLQLNDTLPEIEAFNQLWQSLKAMVNVVKCEWVVGDLAYGIAGTVDALFFNPESETYSIFDWKTGKSMDSGYGYLLDPFDSLPATNLNKYSLQTSLYRLIIERNTDYRIDGCYIAHFSEAGGQIHKALDLRGDLAAILESETTNV